MKFIKLENNIEIPYIQPIRTNDRLYFTSDPQILAQHGYLPLVEADYPEYRPGYRIVRKVVLDESGDHYNEIYEYVELEPTDDISSDEFLEKVEAIL